MIRNVKILTTAEDGYIYGEYETGITLYKTQNSIHCSSSSSEDAMSERAAWFFNTAEVLGKNAKIKSASFNCFVTDVEYTNYWWIYLFMNQLMGNTFTLPDFVNIGAGDSVYGGQVGTDEQWFPLPNSLLSKINLDPVFNNGYTNFGMKYSNEGVGGAIVGLVYMDSYETPGGQPAWMDLEVYYPRRIFSGF